ncbi:hypothetical protein IWQ60_008806 [Tieghemiomyces parasiticus]|uniref:Uncharacterized protein n=1 Tax=Tieghemiomyces parasiticus TaxID=78921 RepID=A0A9W7ZWB3_9FUNG|nr:hypothetical protein IWQ60_008806 [Tieghemiomyces parasiticus]
MQLTTALTVLLSAASSVIAAPTTTDLASVNNVACTLTSCTYNLALNQDFSQAEFKDHFDSKGIKPTEVLKMNDGSYRFESTPAVLAMVLSDPTVQGLIDPNTNELDLSLKMVRGGFHWYP